MKILSLSEAKMKLSRLVENVKTTDEEVVITKNGRPAAVLVSPHEFETWQETHAILSDHAAKDSRIPRGDFGRSVRRQGFKAGADRPAKLRGKQVQNYLQDRSKGTH